MKLVPALWAACAVMAAASFCYAEDTITNPRDTLASTPAVEPEMSPIAAPSAPIAPETHGLKIKQSGFLGFEGGEIVQGSVDLNHATAVTSTNGATNSGLLKKSWMERMLLQYVNDISVTERIRLVLAIECQMSFHYPYDQTIVWEGHQPTFSFYPDRAEGTYTFGDQNRPWLQIGFGYFPFKTAPDVRNLGDYLFRTSTYPVYVMNFFNRPYSRLLGFRFSSTLFDSLHQDLLLTSSNLLPPLVDYSLSYVVSYRFFKTLDIGGGISSCHLFNTYEGQEKDERYRYIKQNGDTAAYNFKGTKAMLRFALDPKALLGWQNIFNQNDLRLYGEWCITALEDQRNYNTTDPTFPNHFYDKNTDRMLYMMGLNLPLFRLIQLATWNVIPETPSDVFAIEVERFPNKYANSATEVFGKTQIWAPIPDPPGNAAVTQVYPWYWSFYFKKTFLDHFALIVQLARDHMRPVSNNPQFYYTEDVLERQGDWWWNVRLNLNY
jgi:hypothetical protein